jgi:geranylgeranyl transferase type-2 subunit beta
VSWIDGPKLVDFIAKCQDADDGGIADRPSNMADIFHTFFGLCGLSLLGYFSQSTDEGCNLCVPINPTYALPEETVKKYRLQYQTLPVLT